MINWLIDYIKIIIILTVKIFSIIILTVKFNSDTNVSMVANCIIVNLKCWWAL